jgi:hypothetical protein
MTTEIPRLVILDLYRNAIDTVEKISRKRVDKKVHAWAVKAKKEVADLMMQVAADEMYGEVEDTSEDKEKKSEEEFYG